MYTLYGCVGTASFAPQMVLQEAGLSHTFVEIDISQGAHRSTEYLSINPAGKVPALVLENGSIMTEASAICLYLADLHRLPAVAPGPHEPDRHVFLQHLLYLATTVQDHYKRYYYPERYSTDARYAPSIKEQAVQMLYDSWRPLEDHLSVNGPYCLGLRHSAADTYLVMLVSWFPHQQEFCRRFPNILRCFGLVADRSVIQAGLEQQTLISVAP